MTGFVQMNYNVVCNSNWPNKPNGLDRPNKSNKLISGFAPSILLKDEL